jgi:hypothetical protein
MSQTLEKLTGPPALCKVDKSLGQAYLSEHSIPGDCSLLGRIEEDVGLFFGIFIIVIDRSRRSKSRIVDSKVEEVWRDTIHVTVIVQNRVGSKG